MVAFDSDISAPSCERAGLKTAKLVTRDFLRGKGNIYFDADLFLETTFIHRDTLIQGLKDLLTLAPDEPSEQGLWRDLEPPNILERMSALDIIEQAAGSSGAVPDVAGTAISALAEIINMPLPTRLTDRQKRVMVGEKYDALTALARLDPPTAFTQWKALASDAQREVLAPALKAAILDRGISRQHVDAAYADLLAANENAALP